MTDSADFVVVGGGVGGLVLARRLVLGGHSVILVEASDRLGGTVARQTVGGIELDAGAESFATRGGTVVKLAKSLRLGDDLVEPNPAGAWLQPATGPAFRLPENSLLGIPGSPLARDVTAIIGSKAGWRAYAETLLPGTYGSKSETVGELVRKRMGDVVVDQLVRPIARGVHSSDVDELPLDQAVPGLRRELLTSGSLARAVRTLRDTSARAGSAVAGIRGGVVRLVDELGADLERFGVDVRLDTRATVVENRHIVAGGRRIDGKIVIAAPGVLDPGSLPGHRVVLATLVVDQPLLDAAPRGTGVLVAEGSAGIRARALTHSTAKWSWLADRAGGKHVLRLSYDEDGSDLGEWARADAEVLLGVPIPASSVLDFARAEWYRPNRYTPTPDDIPLAGESIAGTGLASVVARSEALAGSLLEDAEG
ncbi:MAG TPA: FAD-dependent oxidoreductase [Galbitalea sp.]|nr:FAD-dependent oxidoreductase [Galbitalea sp.]